MPKPCVPSEILKPPSVFAAFQHQATELPEGAAYAVTDPAGEVITADGDIVLNKDRPQLEINVSNSGDRPIQVGSHYHFFEANEALLFEREQTKGMRLDIAAGTAIRFEPGQMRQVRLVPFLGGKKIFGFQQKIMGEI